MDIKDQPHRTFAAGIHISVHYWVEKPDVYRVASNRDEATHATVIGKFGHPTIEFSVNEGGMPLKPGVVLDLRHRWVKLDRMVELLNQAHGAGKQDAFADLRRFIGVTDPR